MKNTSPLPAGVLDFIRREHLIHEGDDILAAVSGGPDSVALLHILLSLKSSLKLSSIGVIHFDHRLRGEESDVDRRFVQSLAESLCLPFSWDGEDVRLFGRRQGISIEMAARACRHRFFRQALRRLDRGKLALGHTADDQAEEILLRLLRGTGATGLQGMLPKTNRGIIRPLLFATRGEILDYLHGLGLPYRDDSTNLEPFCQRNRLRIEVMPLLKRHLQPRLTAVLSRHAKLAQDEEDYWGRQVETHWHRVRAAEDNGRLSMKIEELSRLHPAIQRRVLRFALGKLRGDLSGIYTSHIEALRRLMHDSGHGTKTVHLPGGYQGIGDGSILTLSPRPRASLGPAPGPLREPLGGPGVYDRGTVRLRLTLSSEPPKAVAGQPSPSASVAHLDADKLSWPLFVRTWEPGDRFCPLGLGGSKKLQDFFTDSKVPRPERSGVPLLCDQEKICWIMGYRLDDRVRLTPETISFLTVERLD